MSNKFDISKACVRLLDIKTEKKYIKEELSTKKIFDGFSDIYIQHIGEEKSHATIISILDKVSSYANVLSLEYPSKTKMIYSALVAFNDRTKELINN